MANFNVLMFGSRRTGKSSVLASMIDSFEKINESNNNKITLRATEDTELLLKRKKHDLGSIFERYKDVCGPFAIDENPSDAADTYEFSMTAEGSEDSHMITFMDIPGEWLMSQEKKDELDNEISKSQIIIIAIDTPHLMEEEGDFNNAFNITSQVHDFLKNIKGREDIPRMILFVPIKCEKYYYENRMDEVNKEIKEQYSILFTVFNTEPCKDLYTVAITPILTLGGIVFHDFLRDSEGFVETIDNVNIPALAYRPKLTYYKFYDAAPVFSPKYCEQPVLYLLSFILKVEKMVRGKEPKEPKTTVRSKFAKAVGIISLMILFGGLGGVLLAEMWKQIFKDRGLLEGALIAAEQIKTEGDGYEIIQNPF